MSFAQTLNRRVVIERLMDARDEWKQPVKEWQPVVTVWANVRYLNGTETAKSDMSVSVAKASIRIRYRKDLVAGMRARLGDTIFDIKAVLPDEVQRQHTDLFCETGANDG